MRAAVWYKANDIRVEEREVKEVLANDVKVRVAWTGICGSDLHEYHEGPVLIPGNGPDPLTNQEAPLTLGHEFSGIVEEVGSDVTRFKAGDRVVINPLITYGTKSSEYDIYDGFTFVGLGSDGGFADFAVVSEKNVYALPKGLSLEEGALVEPMAVTVQAVKEGGLQAGQTVAVFGAGPIGLLTIIAAKAQGANKIVVFDLSEERLEKALAVGATHMFNSGKVNPLEVGKEIEPEGFDVSFEVAGVEITLNQAIKITKTRGTVVIVSIFPKPVSFSPMDLTASGIKITSTLAYEPAVFQKTIDMMDSGEINPKEIITSRIELEELVEKGFDALTNDKTQAKILVKLSGEQ
ncbi:2,3-butanediol dehydrogenase [Sporosarcina psychrophila]|uniref:(R,R)-butanediol dehydrogenase/meso-butanediol dehydrogenase/diacetyl reductase n=1 Tax=Sporosarcina psychrophila TaxID=1476 RepID=A0ABV2K7R1_SPOPS